MPIDNAARSSVVIPPPQSKLKTPVPPAAVISIVPFVPPLHDTLVVIPESARAVGSVIVAEIIDVQLFKSVTVTV